jgi:hypothetical protein
VVEHTVDVKFVEELSSMDKVWLFGIVLHDILEAFQEIISGQNFSLFQNLTDNISEFVINDENSVDVLCMIEDLVSNGRGFIIFIIYLLGN